MIWFDSICLPVSEIFPFLNYPHFLFSTPTSPSSFSLSVGFNGACEGFAAVFYGWRLTFICFQFTMLPD